MLSLSRLAASRDVLDNLKIWFGSHLDFVSFDLRHNLLVFNLTLDVLFEALKKSLFLFLADSLLGPSLPLSFVFRVWRLALVPLATFVDFALAQVMLFILSFALAFRVRGCRRGLSQIDLLHLLIRFSTPFVAVLAALVAVTVVVIPGLLLLLLGVGHLLEHLFLDLFFGLEFGAYALALAPVRVLIIEHIFDQELKAV
jgi:hypothetical protein